VDGVDMLAELRRAGVARGDLVGLATSPGVGLGLAAAGSTWRVPAADREATVRLIEAGLRPRWVVWPGGAQGVRLTTCWDIGAVHRLLFGGWRADPGWAWAHLRDLAPATIPAAGQADLFEQGEAGDPADPVGPGGHLQPEWADGGWAASPGRLRGTWTDEPPGDASVRDAGGTYSPSSQQPGAMRSRASAGPQEPGR
jgi:hypothetical protein